MAHYKGALSEAGRAMILQKKREMAKEELELRKKKIEEEMKLASIDNKFAVHYDAVEARLKTSTIGLVTLDEMKAKQEVVVKEREQQLVQKSKQKILSEIEEKRKQKETQRRQIQTLSFRFEDDEEEEENEEQKTEEIPVKIEPQESENSNSFSEDSNSCSQPLKKRKVMKNPDVDTSFLPDREREEEEKRLREQLRQEWVQKQEKLKNEDIEITFSYWDGSGHRRSVKMKKGTSIYQFLHKALELLRKEFHELRAVTADQLMYVKEDLIIPHHYTFYDFIVTKARGKSGPLFSFDVHDDVRLLGDATIEKDESHAGKVLMRSWYERNKHIFPASRWEPYDPSKNYEKYTVSDKSQK